jgi:CRP-like cAMP-binding protein
MTGLPSEEVYLVQSGLLRVTLFPANGREVLIRDLPAGSLFGELAALDGLPRSATVSAVENCELVLIPAAAFRSAISGTPEAALWAARHLAQQIRALTDRVFELSALNARARLHCQLLRLCMDAGVSNNKAIIDPAPTHDVLAGLIGSQREAVSRELGYLTSIGALQQDRRRLLVDDVARLASSMRQATGGDDSWGMVG